MYRFSDSCIFISSSDNTFDVYKKLEDNFKLSLPCDFVKTYVGCNTPKVGGHFELVLAPVDNWNTELKHQIEQLPIEIDYIVLVLDDFWFKNKLDYNELKYHLEFVKSVDADYLRLVPLKRSLFGSILLKIKGVFSHEPMKFENTEPYYSSLQVAIWKRQYLLDLLGFAKNIWHFEHLVKDNSKHFAVRDVIADYTHLVEKGKWLWFASKFLDITPYDLESRPLNRKHNVVTSKLGKIVFYIFGYSIARLNGEV